MSAQIPTSPFRRTAGLITLLALGQLATMTSLANANTQARGREYLVTVGSMQAIAVAGTVQHGRLELALTSLARRMHCPLRRRGSAFYLRLDDQELEFRAFDNVVRSKSEDLYHLVSVPILIDGELYVDLQDIQQLFELRSRPASHTSFTRFEMPVPLHEASVLSQTRQTPPLNSDAFGSGANAGSDGVMLRLSVSPGGPQRSQFQLAGGGKTVRGEMNLDSGGVQDWPYGLLAVGSESRYAQLGQQVDALAGVVFYPARSVGESYNDDPRGIEYFDTLRNGLRRYAGVKRSNGNRSYTLAAETQNHRITGALVGISDRRTSADGTYTRELWVAPQGVALGLYTQTAGRLFAESVTSFATSKFPRDEGDAPFRENMGYRFSPALTLRAGFASAYGVHASGYLSGSINTGNIAVFATKSAASNSLGLTAHGESAYGTVGFSSVPGSSEWLIEAADVLGAGQLQLLASSIGTDSDTTLEWRSTRSTAAMLLGFEALRQGGARVECPIIGVSVALDRDLAAQIETRATASGRAIRLSFAQRIHVGARHRTARTGIHVIDNEPARQLRYIVDGIVVKQTADEDATLETSSGAHTLVVQSLDGASATLPIDFQSGVPAVAPLYRLRAVSGRVIVADPQDFVQLPSLERIEVQLNPGTAIVATDANGGFILPAAPITPDASVQVVQDSLPDGIIAGAPAKVNADGTVTISVLAKRRIQRARFQPASKKDEKPL